MRVLFHMAPDVDHVDASIPFARALASRGHEVVYTATLDGQPAIEERGIRCAPIHRDVLPRGRLAELERLATDDRDRAWIETAERVADEYFRGTIEAFVRELDPQVIVADVITFSPIQLVAHRLGIPCLQLSTTLPQQIDNLPPLTTRLHPDAPWLELEGVRWQESCLSRGTPMIVSAAVDRYAARFGYSADDISFDTVFCPALTKIPEVIACPSALDFPHARDRRPSYIALPVELDRREDVPASLTAFVDDARPLIYASLGRRVGRYPHAKRFFDAVVGALRARPDWQAVIDTGELDDSMFAALPGNVLRLRGAPRSWLLRRAAAFATQAGIAEIREAIALHVPLIAVPQEYDQHGNAARVAHHEIGVHVPAYVITASAMIAAVERVRIPAKEYEPRLRRLDAACREEEAENRGVTIVERLAEGRASGTRAVSAPRVERVVRVGWMFVDPTSEMGRRLAPGVELRGSSEAGPLGVGTVGFTMCPSLGDALARSEGPVLARVELVGDVLCDGPYVVGRDVRCRWVLDAGEALHDFAAWCARAALAPALASAPERVAMFEDVPNEHRMLRMSGAATDRLERLHRATFARASKLWHHGYGAAALAIDPAPCRAARRARFEAIISLARADASEGAGTSEGATRLESQYVAIAKRFDDELERQIAGVVSNAGLDGEGDFVS